jgi:hypothetical protein
MYWNFEWDSRRRQAISGNMGPIAEAATIFDDDALLTIADEHPDEERS